MSGSRQRGGRNNRGRKDTRKYLQGKQGKTDEIRRALTHRARLRKNYFKLLEREGLDVPQRGATENEIQEGTKKTASDGEESASESEKNEDRSGKARKSLSEVDTIKEKVKNHESLTFQERILLKKDRREKDRDRKIKKTKEKVEAMKQSDLKRQRQTERVQNTKTRKGQPLMGPRINNLLDKIRQDKSK